MSSPLTLWHVTCGHFRENGCYGRESANNEIASGDSGFRRNHPPAPTTPEAWSIPCSIALARHPYHCCQTQTDHRHRHAREARYSASRKDHSFAAGSSAPGFSYNHCHRDRASRRALVRTFHSPCCGSIFRICTGPQLPGLIEDKLWVGLAQFETVTLAISWLLKLDLKTQL
jgi:hypothetical protein